MAKKTHVFCTPFPGAGHAINMFNMALVFANHKIQAHVLVMSAVEGEKWKQGTGQLDNPAVQVEVIAQGQWEDWRPKEPRDLIFKIRCPEFSQAVSDKIQEIRDRHPAEPSTALIFNPLQAGLPAVADALGLQKHLLIPVAYYMALLINRETPGCDLREPLVFKGIGGSDRDLIAEQGDVNTGAMRALSRPVMEQAVGAIFTNTDTGLDGDDLPTAASEYAEAQRQDGRLHDWTHPSPLVRDCLGRSLRIGATKIAHCGRRMH